MPDPTGSGVTRPVRVLELRSVKGTGGGPEKTILLGAAQAGPGVDVTVCYLRQGDDEQFSVDRRAAAAKVNYVEVQERHSFDPAIWRSLRAIVRERAIDVVHAHEYKTDVLTWLLSRATRTAALATAHGWTGHSRRERLLYYPADKRVLRRFPLVVAVSSEVKAELVASGCQPERVRVLLNGIDHHVFKRDRTREPGARVRFGVPRGAIAIGAVGRLEPQKRFDLLIDAFASLRQTHSGAHLLIAGEGSARASLEARIATRGLDGCCHLLGHVDDVPLFHHALDVMVQSSDYEGTPNAVLEAMALETPVVATDAGGTAELLRDGIDGLIVRPRDVAALHGAMHRVLEDEGGTRTRAASARRRVETDLSFDRRVRALESIYQELAGARRAS
jgi:glycosyltransferase involved in cell wall biosynthesis